MLHASVLDDDVQLVGFGQFAGSASIENLQRSLVSLSQTGWPATNPGPVTGQVNTQLMRALLEAIGSLAKMSSFERGALQLMLQGAMQNSTLFAGAKAAIESQSATLNIAVLAAVAKRTFSAQPPTSPTSPGSKLPQMSLVQSFQMKSTTPSARALPAGSFQAKTAAGSYRVAVPESIAAGLGRSGLGEDLVELPPRTAPSTGAILITESELDAKLKKPFYKRPLYWAMLGGGVVVAGGAFWLIRR
jgi:hypothetical protein